MSTAEGVNSIAAHMRALGLGTLAHAKLARKLHELDE